MGLKIAKLEELAKMVATYSTKMKVKKYYDLFQKTKSFCQNNW